MLVFYHYRVSFDRARSACVCFKDSRLQREIRSYLEHARGNDVQLTVGTLFKLLIRADGCVRGQLRADKRVCPAPLSAGANKYAGSELLFRGAV